MPLIFIDNILPKINQNRIIRYNLRPETTLEKEEGQSNVLHKKKQKKTNIPNYFLIKVFTVITFWCVRARAGFDIT
jgi:hypothetical protein